MTNRILALSAMLLLSCASRSATAGKSYQGHEIQLDGAATLVYFSDGDSFTIKDPKKEKKNTRLTGFNTLESYGPVHFWGDFNAKDLANNARQATDLARSKPWNCTSTTSTDRYKRMIVDCPDLRTEMLAAGLAHVFVVDGEAKPEDLKTQADAQSRRAGMWSKGIPAQIVTSIHSTKENEDGKATYNRVCDTATGISTKIEHTSAFVTCDTWCHGGSCMVYVPYETRYKDVKPPCFGKSRMLKMVAPTDLRPAP